MREPQAQSQPAPDRWIFAGLVTVLFWIPLPWGSRPEGAQALLGIAAGGLVAAWCMLHLMGRVGAPRLSRTARIALVLWLLWLAWIALQLLPLPTTLLERLSPLGAQMHAGLTAADLEPLGTLSIAPGRTIAALILSVTYAMLYWLVIATVNTPLRLRTVLVTLALAGVAQGLYGALMSLSGLEYGFLERKTLNLGRATGTFVNPNHLAAYLELGLACGIGVVLADLRGWRAGPWRASLGQLAETLLSPRMQLRVMLAIIVIALVLTRSRGGNVAFFAALGVTSLVYLALQRRDLIVRGLFFFLSLFLVDLWIVSNWFGLEAVVQRLDQTQLSQEYRARVLADLVPVVQAYLPWGAGMGAFQDAYLPFEPNPQPTLLDHAHNEPAEFLIESGIPGVAVLGMLCIAHAARALRILARRRRPERVAAAFALLLAALALAIHAMVEFVLHVPAIAASLVVLMAAIAVGSSSNPRRQRSGVRDAPEMR